MKGKYDFAFDESSVYAKVRDVLVQTVADGKVVDLGCGFGALAEVSRAHGFDYVAADLASEGLVDLSQRGFVTQTLDLTDLDAVEALLDAQGPVAAILLLDVLEHLPEPWTLLERLAAGADRWGSPALVVSIPNVTHVDLAGKLVSGRWDVTPTGLLDATHLQLFSAERVDTMLAAAGWQETARADFALFPSDQHFPRGVPSLIGGSPLGDLLRLVRHPQRGHAHTNQFVRAYRPGVVKAPVDAPFLSVLVRTTGNRAETLRDLMLCLAAQTDEDFEVVLLLHGVSPDVVRELVDQQPSYLRDRIRLVEVPEGGGRSRPLNVGVEAARGGYVCVVDDDDVVTADYVEAFHALADAEYGQVLRCMTVTQDVRAADWNGTPGYEACSPFRYSYSRRYLFIEHLLENRTPFCSLAFPATLFRDLGHRFDEDLPVLEDWELQLRAAQLCGVVTGEPVTSIYHQWQAGSGETSSVLHSSSMLHSGEQWAATRAQILARLDSQPVLMPAGTVREVLEMDRMHEELRQEIDRRGVEMRRLADEGDRLRRANAELARTLSARVTTQLRGLADRVRTRRS
jgi:hypothetical protein